MKCCTFVDEVFGERFEGNAVDKNIDVSKK